MNDEFLLVALRRQFPHRRLDRVEECLEYLTGKRRPPEPVKYHEPTRICFPGLAARPWHDVDSMPWVGAMEAAYAEIRREFLEVSDRKVRFMPYEDPYTGELGWSGWDTLPLYRRGKRVEQYASLVPATMKALSMTPHGVRQAMFTQLRPGTHITPHTGGANVVLTCHLALVVPDGCSIRVGDETREWREGHCLVFDDSFLHEAWNRGTQMRGVLLWDIWHPDLTKDEIVALEWLFPLFDKLMRGGNIQDSGGGAEL
jgi:aspartyl/asparaginyl beta-hydroxylase (cupin superfamily)